MAFSLLSFSPVLSMVLSTVARMLYSVSIQLLATTLTKYVPAALTCPVNEVVAPPARVWAGSKAKAVDAAKLLGRAVVRVRVEKPLLLGVALLTV